MERPPFEVMWMERQASFFITGGLVAVHAPERTREAIWDALQSRNVYGTSGDRILLWFDLKKVPRAHCPWVASCRFPQRPSSRFARPGSFEQKPGCAPDVIQALGEERVEQICAGECYNPATADAGSPGSRSSASGGSRARTSRCVSSSKIHGRRSRAPKGELCVVEFEDPTYGALGRDTLYYVRAIQEPTPTVDGGGLRCKGEVCEPCYGDFRTPADDDCLVDTEERAWSSPIFLLAGSKP